MMIDSDEVHKKINELMGIYKDFFAITCALADLGAAITDIEALQAGKNAHQEYALALQGLKDR